MSYDSNDLASILDHARVIANNRAELMTWLKAGAPHYEFDMDTAIGPSDVGCGTACCIAGAAALMAEGSIGKPFNETSAYDEDCPDDQQEAAWDVVSARAMAFLGLEANQSWYGHSLFDADVAENATPEQAAQALQAVIDGNTLNPWKGIL